MDNHSLQAKTVPLTHTQIHVHTCMSTSRRIPSHHLAPKHPKTEYIRSFIHSSNHFGLFTFREEVKRPIVLQPVYLYPSSTLANFSLPCCPLREESKNEKPCPSPPATSYFLLYFPLTIILLSLSPFQKLHNGRLEAVYLFFCQKR